MQIYQGSAFLENVHISEYKQGNRYNHDPLRSRRLLLHKNEIRRLAKAQEERGITIIPLKVYLKPVNNLQYNRVVNGIGKES